jgi:hypothetical protein
MKFIASLCAIAAFGFTVAFGFSAASASIGFQSVSQQHSPVQVAHRASGRLEVQIAHRASGRLEVQVAHRASGRIDSRLV